MDAVIALPPVSLVLLSAVFFRLVAVVSRQICLKTVSSYRALNRERQCDWDSRVVSNIHAFLGAGAGLYFCVSGLAGTPHFGGNDANGRILLISIGYFVHDLILCIQYPYINST